MTRRTSRSDALVDRPALLGALEKCREAVNQAQAKMKVGGPLYYSGSTVVAAIDAMALMVTGDPSYFALKGHSTSGPREDHE